MNIPLANLSHPARSRRPLFTVFGQQGPPQQDHRCPHGLVRAPVRGGGGLHRQDGTPGARRPCAQCGAPRGPAAPCGVAPHGTPHDGNGPSAPAHGGRGASPRGATRSTPGDDGARTGCRCGPRGSTGGAAPPASAFDGRAPPEPAAARGAAAGDASGDTRGTVMGNSAREGGSGGRAWREADGCPPSWRSSSSRFKSTGSGTVTGGSG